MGLPVIESDAVWAESQPEMTAVIGKDAVDVAEIQPWIEIQLPKSEWRGVGVNLDDAIVECAQPDVAMLVGRDATAEGELAIVYTLIFLPSCLRLRFVKNADSLSGSCP